MFSGLEARDMIRAVDWMERGVLPVAGGWLDQTQQFLDAADFTRSEKASALAAMKS